MKDTTTAFTFDLDDLDRATWKERVDFITEEFGHTEPVGDNRSALFIDSGRSLMVSFETTPGIRKNNDGAAPLGWEFVQTHGWSSLTLLSDAKQDWFRDPAVFGYFDRLIDDGFFDDFDQVLFYGACAAGYAAAAYSVAAPDANVLVIQPQATLAPDVARWDKRFPEARRLDFETRYGYAPDMVKTASNVFVVHDPHVTEDAVHASLFNGGNTTHLTCTFAGRSAERVLTALDALPDVIDSAMAGELTPTTFATLWRARRSHMPYLRLLFRHLDGDKRQEKRLAHLCRFVTQTHNRQMFVDKLAEIEGRQSQD